METIFVVFDIIWTWAGSLLRNKWNTIYNVCACDKNYITRAVSNKSCFLEVFCDGSAAANSISILNVWRASKTHGYQVATIWLVWISVLGVRISFDTQMKACVHYSRWHVNKFEFVLLKWNIFHLSMNHAGLVIIQIFPFVVVHVNNVCNNTSVITK